MNECKYLYEIAYSCKHALWERLDAPLSREEYYARVAGKCPACQTVADKAAADKSAKREALLATVADGPRWEDRKRSCPVCGAEKVLVDTAKGVMCRVCRREKGMMDGKQGICDVCRMRLVLHFTGIEGRLMVCRHCWEKVAGKPAPEDWSKTGPKDGKGRKARAGK